MGEYQFTLAGTLAQDLGLKDQKALLCIKVRMDFVIGAGKIIWESGSFS